MLPSVQIFGHSFSTYWMAFAVGLAGMALLCVVRSDQYEISKSKSILFSVLLVICGLIGTKVLYILENWQETIEHGVTLGGQSFFGAVFLIPPFIALTGLLLKMKPARAVAFSAAPVALMISAMRFGCFLNGCCGGIIVNGIRIPTQLIESFGDICILIYLLESEQKRKTCKLQYPFFMIGYSVLRFFIEFVRNTEKDWLYLSHGQMFSLVAFAIGCTWMILIQKRGCNHD